jgi:transcription termination factor Rho
MTAMTTNQQPATRPPAATGVHDAEPVLVSGILDARGSQAFVRTSGCRRSSTDVQVPAALSRQYGLRTGDHVDGAARPRRQRGDGADQHPGKLGVLDRIDSINGMQARQAKARPQFDELTPIYPHERLRLES